MSTALAIAAVSAVLKDLLNNGLIDANLSASLGNSVTISTLPPDRVALNNESDPTQLNLYMYMATPNPGWRNAGLPSRNGNGDRLTNPPLALDLHYLLTAYGSKDFHSEILLGYGMQLFHETPVLPREKIRLTLTAPGLVSAGSGLPSALAAVATSGLADQVEQIKITPQTLNVDEMSKLWTSFQSNYRPSAAYLITVVLIESRRSTRFAPPVRLSNLIARPFKQAVLESIAAFPDPEKYIEAGSQIVIRGESLKEAITRVLISGQEVIPTPSQLDDKQITLNLGALATPLQPGVQTIQVSHLLDFKSGSSSEPHRGFDSNVAAFVLHPSLVGNPTTSAVTSQTVGGVTTRSGNLNITLTPPVGKDQRVVVMLNQQNATGQARAYSFQADPRPGPGPSNSVVIPFSLVVPGQYLVRVQVDGAESALSVDGSGKFNAPGVTI